jgi:hypothetical protein
MEWWHRKRKRESEKKMLLSSQLRSLVPSKAHGKVTVRQLLETLGDEGHFVFILLISFPFCLPIPLPGVSVPFGIIIFLMGLYSMLGLRPWLPEWIMKLHLKGRLMRQVFKWSIWLAQRAEKVMHPRWTWVTEPGWPVRTHCLLITCMGAILALPLPPGTNFPPALVLVLLTLGLVSRDVLFIGAAYLTFLITVGVITGLAILAPKVVAPFWESLCRLFGG